MLSNIGLVISMANQFGFSKITTSGLVLYYDAADRTSYSGTGTTWYDLSGTSNRGTLQGSPTYNSGSNIGIFSFVSSSSQFVSTTNQFTNPQTYTVATWFKTNVSSGTKLIGFEDVQVSAATNYDRHLYVGTNGILYHGIYDSGFYFASSSVSVADDKWHYAVGTFGSGVMKVYMDGQYVSQRSVAAAQVYNGWWKIGGRTLTSWANAVTSAFFTGSIAIAQVYNRELSSSEILQNFNAQRSRFGV